MPTDGNLIRTPLAVVGMACRLPGADGIDAYWRLLRAGEDAVTEMPPERLDRALYYDPVKGSRGKTYSTLSGLVEERLPEEDVCPLPAEERRLFDPCHLVLAGVAGQAFRHAGLDPAGLPDRRIGVYVGHSAGSPLGGEVAFATLAAEAAEYLRDSQEFALLPADVRSELPGLLTARIRSGRPRRDACGGPHTEAGMAAGVIAKAFALDGPQVVVEGACASSLVALGLAALDLQAGAVRAAIVGGASYSRADSLVLFSQAQSCTASGSRPFDDRADGLVSSEGYVALLVKTLPSALADGDTVYAVIRGIGLSSDGRGKSLWAPRREGQVAAIRRAYGPGVEPDQVQYVEAHATSTQLGDATELEALAETFGGTVRSDRRIPIGSVKSNIGHTLETAGLASLLKVVLALRERMIPPTINFREPNRAVPWDRLPFFVATEPLAWPSGEDGSPRRAAVNAFGIGGINAHVVVDEFAAATGDGNGKSELSPAVTGTAATFEPIAVIGRGVILPGAFSVEALDELARAGESQISDAPEDRWRGKVGVEPVGALSAGGRDLWRVPSCRGGFIRDFVYDWRRFQIPPKQIRRANPLQFMLLDAAAQALDEAGYDSKSFRRDKTAVVVGTVFGGEFGNQLQVDLRLPEIRRELVGLLRERGVEPAIAARLIDAFEMRLLEAKPALLDETGSFTSSTLASRIAKTLDLSGGVMSLDAGEASSMAALAASCRMLESGVSDVVLCGGAQRSMDLAAYEALALRGWFGRGGVQGSEENLVPGEGVVVLALKRLSDAVRDGDPVFAVIRGIGAATDGNQPRRAFAEASRRALQASGRAANEVERVNGDLAPSDDFDDESVGLAETFGRRPSAPPLTPLIGHLQAAQPLVSLVYETLTSAGSASARRLVSIGGRARSGLIHQAVVEIPDVPGRPWRDSGSAAETALTCSGPPAFATSSGGPSARTFRFGATSPEELFRLLDEARSAPAGRFESWDESGFGSQDAARVTVLASDPAELAEKLGLAIRSGRDAKARGPLHDKEIVYSERPAGPARVAFLFPGQGSQYQGMARDIVEHSPAARAVVAEADEVLQKLGSHSFSELAWRSEAALGTDVWATQAAMLMADAAWHAALAERAIRADYFAGHSYGEFAALVAAGCWTLPQAIRATRARAEAIECLVLGPTRMLAVRASASQVEEWIVETGLAVFLTHENAPNQTVVGGLDGPVRRFADLLTERGIVTRPLGVPSAFHTPLLRPAQDAWRRRFSEDGLLPPVGAYLNNASNRYVSDPSSIRDGLIAQLAEPVRYVKAIERLADDRARLFLEVGPGKVLTLLHRQILSGRDIVCLASEQPNVKPGDRLGWLAAVAECLWAAEPTPRDGSAIDSRIRFERSRPARAALATGDGSKASRHTNSDSEADDFDATAVRRNRNRGGLSRREENHSDDGRINGVNGNSWRDASAEKTPHAPDDGLASFLVDFVVDETGYPREVVRLDADLEADLGIDSIKKAQLLGELREAVGLSVPEGLTLGEVRTLRQILALLGGAEGTAKVTPADRSRSTAEPEASRANLAREEDDGLASFLVDFVVDETGYPREVVRLDADLEADLGIDSIKKAQLLGELREAVGLSVPEGLTLGEVRTLRQILALLGGAEGTAVDRSTNCADRNGNAKDNRHSEAPSVRVAAPPPQPSHPRYSIGFQRGRREAERVRTALRRLAASASGGGRVDPDSAWQRFSSDQVQELHGLADGAGVHVANLVAYNLRSSGNGASVDDPALLGGRDTNARQDRMTPTGGQRELAPPKTNDRPSNRKRDPQTADRLVDDAVSPNPSVTGRFVLRMAPAPRRRGAPKVPTLTGGAIILGSNVVAEALARRLQAAGIPTRTLRPTPDPSRAAEEIDAIWQEIPSPHLFVTTPWDSEDVTELDWVGASRRESRLMGPFWACRRWLQLVREAGLADDASLTGLTALGGDFGLSGHVLAAESGGVAGLLKAVLIENWVVGLRSTPVRLVDAGRSEKPEAIAEAVLLELAAPTYDVEVAWDGGNRRALRAVPQPVPPRRQEIARGGTWVLTGGARGITAHVALVLAERFGLNLHLIGTAPVPEIPESWRGLDGEGLRRLREESTRMSRAAGRNPLEEWRGIEKALEIDATLRALSRLGVTAAYHQCDAANREELKTVLDRVRKESGPIEGVLHGAGVGQDARFDRKDPGKVERCFRAKNDGASALMELTQDDPLKYFVAFGSISGRFGANGHTDYSAANDMLAKQVDWFRSRRPEVAAVTFHWHAWDDFGMATKPETRLALEAIGMRFMPAAEGVSHLIAELEAGAPEPEVLITDQRYQRAFGIAETSDGAPDPRIVGSLLESEAGAAGGVATAVLDPTVDPFLTQHRLDDRPLLPIVIGMELLCEAASRVAGREVLALRDVRAFGGLVFHSDQPKTVRLKTRQLEVGTFECDLTADVTTREGMLVERDRIYFAGIVETGSPGSVPFREPLALPRSWRAVTYAERGAKFFSGLALQCLRKIDVGSSSARGLIATPDPGELAGPARMGRGWALPAAVLDACLYATGQLAWERVEPGVALPVAFDRLRIGRAPEPGEPCVVEIRFVSRDGRRAWFDFDLWGDNGELILQAEGYQVSWISG